MSVIGGAVIDSCAIDRVRSPARSAVNRQVLRQTQVKALEHIHPDAQTGMYPVVLAMYCLGPQVCGIQRQHLHD